MFRYFKFKLNDTVQFTENDSHLYRIVGYRLEKGCYGEQEWAHVIYELLRDFDGYMVDAEEAELVKIVQVEGEYYKIENKSGYSYPVKIKPVQQPKDVEPGRRIDELLDTYNDYKRLALLFNDVSYETRAEEILGEIRCRHR